MAPPKKGTPGYERLRAFRIGEKIKLGKEVSMEERSWYIAYKQRTGAPAATGPETPPHVTSQRVETNPIEAQATSVPQTAPPPMEVPPLGESTGGPAPSAGADTNSAGGSTNASAPSAGATPNPPASQKDATVAALVDMAATAWIAGMDRLAKMTGSPERMFPDEFIDKIWKPAAQRLGVKYLPDSMGSDVADAVVLVGPPAATVFAFRRVAAQLKAAESGKAEIAARPVAMPDAKPETAASSNDGAPASSQGANGHVMSKADIRKTKLAPSQIPEVF